MLIVLQKYCGQRVKETKLLKSKQSYLNACLVHQEPVVLRTLTQMVLVLWGFDLQFFEFTWVQKRYTFSRNPASDFEFWSFPELVMCSAILSHDGRQCLQVSTPNNPQDQDGKQPSYSHTFCTTTTILIFTFSIVFNKLCEMFNTLYKIGFG